MPDQRYRWKVSQAYTTPVLQPFQNKVFPLSQEHQSNVMKFTGSARTMSQVPQSNMLPAPYATTCFNYNRPVSSAAARTAPSPVRFSPAPDAYNRVGQNKRLSTTMPVASRSLPPLRGRALDQHIHNAYQTCARFNCSSPYGTGRKQSHITYYRENLLRKH